MEIILTIHLRINYGLRYRGPYRDRNRSRDDIGIEIVLGATYESHIKMKHMSSKITV